MTLVEGILVCLVGVMFLGILIKMILRRKLQAIDGFGGKVIVDTNRPGGIVIRLDDEYR